MNRDTTFLAALLMLVLANLHDGAWQTAWSIASLIFAVIYFADLIAERYQRRRIVVRDVGLLERSEGGFANLHQTRRKDTP